MYLYCGWIIIIFLQDFFFIIILNVHYSWAGARLSMQYLWTTVFIIWHYHWRKWRSWCQLGSYIYRPLWPSRTNYIYTKSSLIVIICIFVSEKLIQFTYLKAVISSAWPWPLFLAGRPGHSLMVRLSRNNLNNSTRGGKRGKNKMASYLDHRQGELGIIIMWLLSMNSVYTVRVYICVSRMWWSNQGNVCLT